MPRSLSQLLQWKLHQLKKEAMWGVVLKTTAATAFIPLPWNRSIHPSEFNGNLCLMTPGSVSSVVTCTSCRNLQCTILHLIHLPPVSSLLCLFSFDGTIIPPTGKKPRCLGVILHSSFFLTISIWTTTELCQFYFFKKKIWSTLPFWFLALCRFI